MVSSVNQILDDAYKHYSPNGRIVLLNGKLTTATGTTYQPWEINRVADYLKGLNWNQFSLTPGSKSYLWLGHTVQLFFQSNVQGDEKTYAVKKQMLIHLLKLNRIELPEEQLEVLVGLENPVDNIKFVQFLIDNKIPISKPWLQALQGVPSKLRGHIGEALKVALPYINNIDDPSLIRDVLIGIIKTTPPQNRLKAIEKLQELTKKPFLEAVKNYPNFHHIPTLLNGNINPEFILPILEVLKPQEVDTEVLLQALMWTHLFFSRFQDANIIALFDAILAIPNFANVLTVIQLNQLEASKVFPYLSQLKDRAVSTVQPGASTSQSEALQQSSRNNSSAQDAQSSVLTKEQQESLDKSKIRGSSKQYVVQAVSQLPHNPELLDILNFAKPYIKSIEDPSLIRNILVAVMKIPKKKRELVFREIVGTVERLSGKPFQEGIKEFPHVERISVLRDLLSNKGLKEVPFMRIIVNLPGEFTETAQLLTLLHNASDFIEDVEDPVLLTDIFQTIVAIPNSNATYPCIRGYLFTLREAERLPFLKGIKLFPEGVLKNIPLLVKYEIPVEKPYLQALQLSESFWVLNDEDRKEIIELAAPFIQSLKDVQQIRECIAILMWLPNNYRRQILNFVIPIVRNLPPEDKLNFLKGIKNFSPEDYFLLVRHLCTPLAQAQNIAAKQALLSEGYKRLDSLRTQLEGLSEEGRFQKFQFLIKQREIPQAPPPTPQPPPPEHPASQPPPPAADDDDNLQSFLDSFFK